MNEPRRIPDDVLFVQRAASDPSYSAWVGANAGSGKTHVLAHRVIRLMLGGVEPARILCLTFTKAAAANMANQVFRTLAQWVALDNAGLDRAVARLEGMRPDAAKRTRARRLFAEALETPGGLKVQTIHAFCTRLLHQFPFEADVAARFQVLEEGAQRDLLERSRLEVLLEAAKNPGGALAGALSAAIAAGTDRAFEAAIGEMIGKRAKFVAWLEATGGILPAIAALSRTLGVASTESLDATELAMTRSPILPPDAWPALARMLAAGSPSDCERAKDLTRAVTATGAARRNAYLLVFLTGEGEPRRQIVTKAFATRHPEFAARLDAEQARLTDLEMKRRALAAQDRTAAVLAIAEAVVRRYRRAKETRGLLDYDDLIDKASVLLANVEAAWVHYKLDLGIDHVLIDEAQDTSPKQWAIIQKLVSEFTAGEGARAAGTRSIFAVGDEKQSIFSFQGAAPEQFAQLERDFAIRHRDAELDFMRCRFQFSFRSGANVLGAVDAVFARPAIFSSVTSDPDGIPPHVALPGTAPGLVEIWPMIEAEKQPEVEAWDAPFDQPKPSNLQAVLADRIAATIRTLIRQGRSPGDVLILVRQRGPLFEAAIRALKDADVPVAGADRLVLTEHIAVMDLLALADALLLPQDDLALATVLKSPMFGFDDDQLFQLAWNRRGTLRSALDQARDPMFEAARARLDRFAEMARNESPFGFYAGLFGAEGVRRQMLARLGPEAADALGEFMNLALEYERGETPSLPGFVAFMRAAAAEVKRDMDIVRDEVRVMTVHGAKGLEAPVVILADTTTRPTGPRDPRILALPVEGAPPGTPDCLIWALAAREDVAAMKAARARARNAAEDEYRRLLYVGMTRAAEYLIICGAQGANGRPPGCWYDLVWDALATDAVEEPALDGNGTVRRWRTVATDIPPPARVRSAPEPTRIPDWLSRNVTAPAISVRAVSPSKVASRTDRTRFVARGSSETERKALMHGRLVHRLMQSLPEVPPQSRIEAARHHLAQSATDLDERAREELIDQVIAILDDARFAPLFAPGTRAEVPIRARLSRSGRPALLVAGQVDRLAISPTTAFVADYKTDRPAPRRIEDAPEGYVAQLALYREVLAQIYPDRAIRAALLWTDTAQLMEVPARALDSAFATIIDRPD